MEHHYQISKGDKCMSYGGGTFTEKNKEIPGVYANFSNIDLFNSNITYGVVVLILPVCYTGEKPSSMDRVTITKNDYRTVLVSGNFPTGESGGYTIETISEICLEIFQNATTIHVVPLFIKTSYDGTEKKWEYTMDSNTENSLKTFIEPLSFNTILCLSVPDDGSDYGTTSSNPTVFLNVVSYFINQTTLRFQWVWGISNTTFIGNIYTSTTSTPLRKWFVLPYSKTASPYIAGLLSSLSVGRSAAGILYNGKYSNQTNLFAPPTKELQISSLNNGYFCYYTLGTMNQLRVLKDITMDHYKSEETFSSDYNDRMGQIVRIQIYMYNFFNSIFPTQLQGKPNNAVYRSVIKGIILSELRDLESRDVIEDVSEDHVTVTATEGQKDSVDITIQYKPVSGIDYVYITFYVN